MPPVIIDGRELWLGRVEAPDPRDHPMAAILGEAPRTSRYYRTGVILDQGQTNSCFPAGTLVRMATGEHRPIEELHPLDEVVTAEGNTGRVMQVQARFHGNGLIRLQLWGHRHLRATPEHPLLTKRGYVPISELKPGDYVALTRFTPVARETILTSDYVSESERKRVITTGRIVYRGLGGIEVPTEVVPLPKEILLTPGIGRLFGLFLAEGYAKNQVVLTFGSHERNTLVAEAMHLFESELGLHPRLQERGNHTWNVVVGGIRWAHLFGRLFGVGSANKGLPSVLACGPIEFRREMLRGWIDGDGYRRRTTTQGVTVSHKLVMDMYAIAQELGLKPTIRLSHPKISHTVKIRRPRWDLEMADGDMDSYRSSQDDQAVWRRVVGLEFEDFAGYVYNCRVEGDESYVAEGVGVHNCVGFTGRQWMQTAPVMFKALSPSGVEIYRYALTVDEFHGEADTGTSIRAGVKALQHFGRVASYVFAYSAEEVRQWIMADKGSVIVGTTITENMAKPDSKGYMNPTGRILGGHAYLLMGYSLSRNAFRMTNSWARSWGENGRAWIRFSDFDDLLRAQGDAVGVVEVPLR